jgi:radical SAM protein with 4Fe4S-binding SPASM domain
MLDRDSQFEKDSPAAAPVPEPLKKRWNVRKKLAHYAKVFHRYKISPTEQLDYIPEDILLEVTNVCNFKCAFCVQSQAGHHDIVPKNYLVPQRADKILKNLRAGGVRTNVIHWTHDGEPFMNKQFHKICEVGVANGFTHMYFATNAMLCTPDRMEQLPKDGCRFTLIIDFCYDKDQFEEIRGTRGSWDTIRKNILEILTNEKFSHISLEVKDISTFGMKDQSEAQGNLKDLASLFPSSPRLKLFDKTFHNGTGFLGTKDRGEDTSYFLCPYPWTSLSISSTGDVVACCRDLQHKTTLGNMLEQSLDEVWNGAPMRKMRKALINKKPQAIKACAECDMPYDTDKFSFKNIRRTVAGRLQMFSLK